MRRTPVTLTLLLVLAATGGARAAAKRDATVTAAEHQKEIDTWHAKRIDRLKAEDGWLALVGLHWLEEGDNPAGSAEDAKVQLPANAPARLGTFIRQGKQVRFVPARDAKVTLEGKRFTGGAVKTDAEGKPDTLRVGSLQLLVIDRGERVGVRVRDAEARLRREFKGIARFPVGPQWRKEATFVEAKAGESISIPNVLGDVSEVPLAGTAVFAHDGQEHKLIATREGDSLFFVFGDETNRTDTYGAGRFLYTELPKDGKVVLDFNKSYNPPCAFSHYATCPLPPKGNKLKLRVEAGEKRFAEH